MNVVDLEFGQRTIGSLLRVQAREVPDAPWLLFGDDVWTFGEADAAVDRYAAGLAGLGVGHGDMVAVMLDNGPDFAFVALALARSGAVMVPVNLALRGRSLRHVLTQARVTTLVAGNVHFERVLEVYDGDFALRLAIVDGTVPDAPVPVVDLAEVRAGGRWSDGDVATTDLWCVMYTSGTTGPSKGAAMTHQYWYVAPQSITTDRAIRSDDVFYVCSPMFHAASWLVQILPALLLGLPVGIDEGFSTTAFWDRVRHYGASQILTMAASHLWLWNQPEKPDDADNPARVWAPVPLPAELYEPFMARFGLEHLWFTYGGTEFMSVTRTRVGEPLKPGSSGRPREGIEVMIADDDDLPVPAGVVGELLVRPTVPHAIFEGYHRMPEATLDAFRNLWYHSGDLATMDDEGEVYFVDRKADYLRVRGENVSSFEVESALAEHPSVAEVAAFSVRTDEAAAVQEDEIKVNVVVRDAAAIEPADLLEFARRELAKFAVPRFVELVDSLPRTETGRVRKNVLRADPWTVRTWDAVRTGYLDPDEVERGPRARGKG